LKNGVLTKKVDSRVHRLHFLNGYGIDKSALEYAIENGAKTILIIEKDTDREFRVSVNRFLEKSIEVELGHGKQMALALSYFETAPQAQERLF